MVIGQVLAALFITARCVILLILGELFTLGRVNASGRGTCHAMARTQLIISLSGSSELHSALSKLWLYMRLKHEIFRLSVSSSENSSRYIPPVAPPPGIRAVGDSLPSV